MPRRPPSYKVYQKRWNRHSRELQRGAEESKAAKDRLFMGVYPCGIVYADKGREVDGDYARLAFLPYKELVLDIKKNCPPIMRELITADAARVIARRGQRFQVSTIGQTITLGQ